MTVLTSAMLAITIICPAKGTDPEGSALIGSAADLAVIFDRTCPDRAAWSQALAVAAGSISWLASTATGGDDLWGDESRDSGRLNGPDFNKVIRTALGDALAGVLEGQSTRVKAWWFADTAGEGIETPDGVELPLDTYGSVDAAILHQAFRECTYCRD